MSTNPNEPQEKEKRKKVEYKATVNYEALKRLEGTIESSFLQLVYNVILIDGKPYKEWTYKNDKGQDENYKLTTGRKNEFLHLIKEYAVIDFIGIKCHIIAVVDESAKEEIRNARIQRHIEKI